MADERMINPMGFQRTFPSYGPHRTIEEAVNVEMKLAISIAVLVACGLGTGLSGTAQSPSSPQSQSKQSDKQKAPSNPQQPGSQSNPFPEDTTSVPLMPNGNTPAAPDVPSGSAAAADLPRGDVDPVRSPDDPVADSSTATQGFSSSTAGMDRVMPPPDTDSGGGTKNHAPEHQESAAEDESVGNYYLSTKNWKAALSRFESAVVLDPENPEVYWGLGEAQRHLGQLTDAKASYQKLVEYDPDSKHGKEARKMLKDPELANAPTASAAKP
jgi:tetratricopeptide (TPR) repeat protein